MKYLYTIISILFLSFVFIQTAQADGTSSCTPIYGGGRTCTQTDTISIKKTVAKPYIQNPINPDDFVQNLDMTQTKYVPGQEIKFQITVTNIGKSTIDAIKVQDIFPASITFIAGPGSFDSNTHTLTYTLSNMKANESRTDTLRGQIVTVDKLSSNQDVECDMNQATASQSNQNSSATNVQFCIQKQMVQFPTTTKGGLHVQQPSYPNITPSTGPEALSLIALIPTLAAGIFLRKKAI